MLKVAIKHASRDHVRHRVIAPEVVMKLAKKLDNMKGEVAAVLQDEKEEKQASDWMYH
jgi:ATP-dependent RNA helicase DDX27